MIIFIVFIALLLILLLFSKIYNKLVRQKASTEEAFSGVDVQLKRRYDLIPNLVAVAKQYGVHEKEIFEEIARQRNISAHATSIQQKSQAEQGLSQALRTLFAVVESYPTLKANENYMALHNSLQEVERELQLARRYYNGTVRNYNITVQAFPSALVARATGFNKAPYFEVESTTERDNVRVTF
ncbi:MAG TPA: LemA family protein [Candidatus Babeliaceae bacterium]|nr:LemA family protein [Candidatus Babeliaceae bacterium]